MSRDQKIITALVIALFVACNTITCLGGLILGSVWTVAKSHLIGRSIRQMDPDFDRPSTPAEPWEQPGRVPIAALITEVVEDGPAAQAGLEPGDLILAIDGERIERGTDIRQKLSIYQPGDRVELTVRRGNRERDIQVRLGRRSERPEQPYLGLTYRLVPAPPR